MKFNQLILTIIIFICIAACSDGGAGVEENPIPPPPPSSEYSGPAPQTDDIQSFKINLWDNLSPSNRCGQCHGIGQVPAFVDLNDVNFAYSEANKIVDLTQPSQSRMVTKVAEGHNCWLTSNAACADTIISYISAWAGSSAATTTNIELVAPTLRDPATSRSFPESSELFSTTVYPLLANYCANCHNENSANPIAPYFANADVDSAYAAAKSKINLDVTENSRFVVRLRDEFHNCWSECTVAVNGVIDETLGNAGEMLLAIRSFVDQIPLTEIDPDLLISKSLFIGDGIVASGGGRFDTNVVALWNFKTGEGETAFDTSGVEPAINLTLTGSYNWVGGWGLQIVDGKAQSSTSQSKKLHDLIKATGEYSIEAWVIPSNVTQEGPARIISYSAGTTARNFTLGQTLYNYDFLNRSSETDANGEAALSTDDDDEVLQAALQHVVATFSPTEGRKIYVNGELVASESLETSGSLNDWDDTFAVIMGNEVSGDRLWQGILKMVAIHNRALTLEQIQQNFDVGVGEKFFMLFSISHLIDLPDAFIVFVVSQFDSYSYLFDQPFFISLDPEVQLPSIPLEKIRIALNGKEVKTGQAYKNIVTELNASDYQAGLGQKLSALGTVIALDKGPAADEFFLSFEKIADAENTYVEPSPPDAPAPVDLPARPDIGIKSFNEIFASMSKATQISMANPGVMQTYETVKQQLPTLTDIDFFNSAQQMGITQLAISFCNELVEDSALRSSYFPGFDFSAAANLAFDSDSKRTQIFGPLMTQAIGNNIATQPDAITITNELNALTDDLIQCGNNCATDRTETVVKAVCAATLGNAAVLIQ